ncbi:hypothetical protein PAALTS15_15606 [Paenibacillus alvei TS-15]|uniref:Kasugamycin N-acetyltransferase AAC(2')-IIb n=1 Tax=Paenibacillus alvei TS-15 TaxID=1117108 RepID=S9SLJ1_PAEAL|nr:kasugamycin N-acetyltransferase AAC(2')-IIb [Paenibacillus alvei]EPY06587.1 hypothetical protein PAALTS15_15606 [Paenibacillus alvei TS-15]
MQINNNLGVLLIQTKKENPETNLMSSYKLMNMHAEALFTHDDKMRLRSINEPWPGERPAPRFFLGRTMDGKTICRFRHDIPFPLVEQLESLCRDEPAIRDNHATPKHYESYMSLLHAEQFTMGPCYYVPDTCLADASSEKTVTITKENITKWDYSGFEWLASEIEYAQPCVAIVHHEQIVSLCRSVRISSHAHEAGLETLHDFRGQGYAAHVVASWALAVRRIGAIPLYSTLCDNLSSQRVAAKANLPIYGVNFTIR